MNFIKNKNLIKLIALILMLTMITGCWGQKDIEGLALVLGAGIDKGEKDYIMTLQVARPPQLQAGGGSQGGGGNQQSPTITYSAAGRTLFEAVRSITKQSARQVFFGHNQLYVIGEEAGKAGISNLLDFISRDAELLYTTLIVTCRGKASDLLQTKVEEKVPAMAITNILENVDRHGQSTKVNIKDLSLALYSNSGSYLLPCVQAISAAEGKEQHFELNGASVFKGDKLVGYFNTTQMRGYLILTGKLKGGVMVVPDPENPGNEIALELQGAKTKLKPLIEEGRPVVEAYITETATIANENIIREQITKQNKKAIEHLAALGIVSQIENTFATAQEMQADVFGFADLFERKKPASFKQMKANWDDVFPEMELRIYADCDIKTTGLKVGNQFEVR